MTAPPGSTGLPAARPVESQPLLSQIHRLATALQVLGTPFLAKIRTALQTAADQEPAAATRTVEALLDPLCAGAFHLRTDGTERVVPALRPVPLIEHGWARLLVKVVNDREVVGALRVHSPSAGPAHGATATQAAARWMEIGMADCRPLDPELSGLALEYRIVEIYSQGRGRRSATLAFDVDNEPEGDGPHKRWTFESGPAGWTADNDCRAVASSGRLLVDRMGRDPYLSAPVRMRGGAMRLRLRATSTHDDIGMVFWATADRPQFDGGRMATFAIGKSAAPQAITVDFPVVGELVRLRIDPVSQKPGRVAFQTIDLIRLGNPDRWASARFDFDIVPSVPVLLRVRDTGNQPAVAAFTFRDSDGRIFPPQTRRLAPDFFFQTQVYRADGETVRLPPGTYTVDIHRGPETIPQRLSLRVGSAPTTLSTAIRRWIDPSKRGWWSGDHHIHAAGCQHYENPTQGVRPADMARHTSGEDLKVGCNLTWGPCFDFQKQFFTGGVDRVSRYPYLLRYDIEVSGFGSSASGHLCLLRLREQLPPGGKSKDHWPTLGLATLRWAKRQGAVCGTAHSALGLTDTEGKIDGPEGPDGLPNLRIPRYDGIGANEFIMQVTHRVPGPGGKPVPAIDFLASMNTDRTAEWNLWYHVLNCGYRPRLSGETDFPCISGDRVGKGRVYVWQPGRLDFDDWCEGLREGRSYVSDGRWHLMDFSVDNVRVGRGGSELRLASPGMAKVRVLAAALDPERQSGRVDVVVNGLPVAGQELVADGRPRWMQFTIPIARSSWVAVRMFPNAHTNPIWVTVGGKPVRASRASALWCRAGVDRCWEQKLPSYAAAERQDAARAYDHARRAYERIAAECPTGS